MPEQPWVPNEPEGHLGYFRLDLPGHDHDSEWTKPYLDALERQRYERFLVFCQVLFDGLTDTVAVAVAVAVRTATAAATGRRSLPLPAILLLKEH